MKAKDTGTIDLWEIIYLFRNNLGKILLCVLLSMAVAVFYLSRTRSLYDSSVLLEIVPDTPDQGQTSAITNLDDSDILQTIDREIASQSVLLGVIEKNNLANDPDFITPQTGATFSGAEMVHWIGESFAGFLKLIKADRFIDTGRLDLAPSAPSAPLSTVELMHRLAARISVSLVRGSRLISMTVEDHDPKKAQQLAQSVIDEFFRQSWDERSRNLASARELLLAEVRRDNEALQTSEEKLEAYRKKYDAVSLEDQQNIVVDRLRELNRQEVDAQNARLAMEPEAEQVRTMMNSDLDQLLNVRRVAETAEVIDLRQQIALQEAQVATLAKRYGPLHPTMIQAQSHLQALRSSLTAALRRAGDRILQSYGVAQATEAALKGALDEQEKRSMQLDEIAIPYHTLEREVQANATVYQKMLGTLKQVDAQHSLMTLSDADGFDVRTIEQPLVPTRPARPRSTLILALSAVAGLFLGCGSALVSRALDNTVSSVDEAESFLGLSVLATVPRSRHQSLTGQPVLIKYPQSAEAEAFRSLRTSLSLLPGQDEQKCILFTSAVPAEGKSYCSLNTAAALAQQGFQTLLIDGDLRRPGLQRLLVGWNENPGLTDCLQRPDLFEAAVLSTPVENLFCLGDRKYRPGGAELLGKDGLLAVLERAQAVFDRIVIDTAPLMAVSDALYIAKNVSTVCLVVHAGRTPRRLVRRAIKQLDEIAKRTATGVILNKADRRAGASTYYYYNVATKA